MSFFNKQINDTKSLSDRIRNDALSVSSEADKITEDAKDITKVSGLMSPSFTEIKTETLEDGDDAVDTTENNNGTSIVSFFDTLVDTWDKSNVKKPQGIDPLNLAGPKNRTSKSAVSSSLKPKLRPSNLGGPQSSKEAEELIEIDGSSLVLRPKVRPKDPNQEQMGNVSEDIYTPLSDNIVIENVNKTGYLAYPNRRDVYGEQASQAAEENNIGYTNILFHHTGNRRSSPRRLISGMQRIDPATKSSEDPEGYQRGYQFIVDLNGKIYQGVPMSKRPNQIKSRGISIEEQIALHQKGEGIFNINTIGISVIGDGKTDMTAEQIETVLALTEDLSKKFNIDPENVTGHGIEDAGKQQPSYTNKRSFTKRGDLATRGEGYELTNLWRESKGLPTRLYWDALDKYPADIRKEAIKIAQQQYNEEYPNRVPLDVDGILGPKTKNAVRLTTVLNLIEANK